MNEQPVTSAIHATCWTCGRTLGSSSTITSDGRMFHPECVPVAHPTPSVPPPLPGEVGELEAIAAIITPDNFAHEREIGDVYGWCERIRRRLTAHAAELELTRQERDEWATKGQMMADAAGSWMARAEAAEAALASAKDALRELANAARSACDARQHTDLINALVEADRRSLLEPSEEPK